jgi:hypothetical protein
VKKLNADTRRVLPSVVGQRNGARTEHLATLWFMAAIFTYLDQRSLPFSLVFARSLESRAFVRASAYSRVDLDVHNATRLKFQTGWFTFSDILGWIWMYMCKSKGLININVHVCQYA